jgi:hypothetical protein
MIDRNIAADSLLGVMATLTPEEALKWLDGTLDQFPQRTEYQDICRSMLWMTTNIVRDEREAFVGALRICLRERRDAWLAFDLAAHHHLTELRPDIEAVAARMERADGYPAYYREFVPRVRKCLETL